MMTSDSNIETNTIGMTTVNVIAWHVLNFEGLHEIKIETSTGIDAL
jgi:hypothetical protein